jgi:hypothetical protein
VADVAGGDPVVGGVDVVGAAPDRVGPLVLDQVQDGGAAAPRGSASGIRTTEASSTTICWL